MEIPKIFESEYRFCLLLWEYEPIKSGDLTKLCSEKLKWKKSTTFTVIKRLADRGVLKNENSIVTSLISKDEVLSAESHSIVERTFDGSLPQFIAAFTKEKALSPDEVADIKRMIEKYEGDNHG